MSPLEKVILDAIASGWAVRRKRTSVYPSNGWGTPALGRVLLRMTSHEGRRTVEVRLTEEGLAESIRYPVDTRRAALRSDWWDSYVTRKTMRFPALVDWREAVALALADAKQVALAESSDERPPWPHYLLEGSYD